MSVIKDAIVKKVEALLCELIGPQAQCKAALSSGEQKFYTSLVEYLLFAVDQSPEPSPFDALETVWRQAEPEIRACFKQEFRQTISPMDFSVSSQALKDAVVFSFDLDLIDTTLRDKLKYALDSTRDVIGKHEWVKSELMPLKNKIGHFVTNLRRNLDPFIATIPAQITNGTGYSLRDFLANFYNVGYWCDICVPQQKVGFWSFFCTHNAKVWNMNSDKVAQLCAQVKDNPSDQIGKEIDVSLAILQRDMYPLKNNLDKLLRINNESEQILGKLCEIVEGK